MKAYLIGSLRNPEVPLLAKWLRENSGPQLACGQIDVFDSWFAAGPEADDCWQRYSQERGQHYSEALYDHAATHVYEFDLQHISTSHVGILMLPAGKSGHLELGYMAGQGKPTFVYFSNGEPERWDVMYQFATRVVFTKEELLHALCEVKLWP